MNWADNYQVKRALNYRDKKIAKLLLKSNNLSKNNDSLKGTVHEQKPTIKDITHQMHVDAKANHTASVQAEDVHQADLAALAEYFESEIEEAYAVANTKTEKSWRLRASAFLQKESTRRAWQKSAPSKMEKMDKERASQRAIVTH